MSTLFDYPKQSYFGRVLPKNKVYQHGGLSRKMQAMFVEQIKQITWAYKLAPETVNLSATDEVKEIQVFRLRLHTRNISENVLAAIDKAVPFPIIFELLHHDNIRIMAAYKRPSDSDSSKWVVSAYLAGEWIAADSKRHNLPLALNMDGLYEKLLSPLMPHSMPESMPPLSPVLAEQTAAKADLRSQIAHIEALKAQETNISKIEARLSREKQFNRKVEINSQLREARAKYNMMTKTLSTKD